MLMIIKLPYIKSAGEVHAASAAITAKKKKANLYPKHSADFPTTPSMVLQETAVMVW